MNTKNINRIIRGLTLSLCMGFIFTHTTVYAAGPLGGPAGGPTPSNDLMKAPMGVQSVRQQLPDKLPADASMKAPMLGAPGGGGDAGDAKSMRNANCYCHFYANGVYLAANNTQQGGYTQIPNMMGGCSAQDGCHKYCNGAEGDSSLVAAAAAHRCGNVQITAQSSVGTEGYCSNGNTPKTVTGTGIYTAAHCPSGYVYPGGVVGSTCVNDVDATVAPCGPGYWRENTYGVSANPHPVCVKQSCPQTSMPGVPAWQPIGNGTPSSGGVYLTDDKGGTRFFIDSAITCPPGHTLLPGLLVCRQSTPATPASCQ